MAYRHHPGVYDPKFKSNSRRRELEELMSDWYGSRFSALEITKRTEEAKPLSHTLDKILEQCLTQDVQQTIDLQENWAEIIGTPLNTYTSLAAIKEGRVFVEVKHPAFLIELRKKSSGEAFLKKLQAHAADMQISEIVFVPAGQYRPDDE